MIARTPIRFLSLFVISLAPSVVSYLNSPKNTPSIAEGLDGDEFGIVGEAPTINSAYKAH
jgi:hypothetical protein